MSEAIDLSGVHPTRWAEIQKRVQTIEAYLRIPHRSYVDEAQFAEKLGLSPKQFARLVSVWVRHKDPSKLPGAQATRSAYATPNGGLGQQVYEIIERHLAAAVTSTKPAEIWRRIDDECKALGLKAPSQQAIWSRMRARRLKPDIVGLVIDYCLIDLPIEGHPSNAVLGMALAPSGFIAAHNLMFSDPTPQSSTLLIARAATLAGDTAPAPILMPREPGSAWDELEAKLQSAGVKTIGPNMSPVRLALHIPDLIGKHIGGLPLRFRRPSLARPATSGRYKPKPPVDPSDLPHLVASAIEKHNMDVEDTTVPAICRRAELPSLTANLLQLANKN